MTDDSNRNAKLYKWNAREKFTGDSATDLMPLKEETTMVKTEVKEEVSDFEMPVHDMEYVENNFGKKDLVVIKSRGQSLNENLGRQLTSTIADNSNMNLHKWNTREGFKKDSLADMMPSFEEITVMKTEVKEEVYDIEMPVNDIEHVEVKEEYISSVGNSFEKKDLDVITSREQMFDENLVSGKCQLGEEDLQKEQELSTKRLVLKYNKAEGNKSLKKGITMEQDGESKKYKCADCKYTAHQKHDVKRHIRTHTKDRPFKCTYKNCECTAGQEDSCKCDMCGYAAAEEHNLRVHILVKHSGEPKKYKCADCKFAAHKKHNLERHMRTHTNDKPFKCMYKNCECTGGQEESCKCDMCGYAAAEEHNLKMHILVKHSGAPKKYKCEYCNYTTHEKRSLERHIRTHTNDRPFKCTYKNCVCTAGQEESCRCDMCGFAAKVEYHLNEHILRKHSGESKKYKCPLCEYTTHKKEHLTRHNRTHTNERPFKCTYKNCECSVEQQEFCKCDMCGYAATEAHNLKIHIFRKHSGKSKKYKCPDCKYTANKKHDLKQHIRTHTNDRLIKCTYKNCKCTTGQEESCKYDMCGYAAGGEHNLKVHILAKHGAEPKEYKCTDCEYTTHEEHTLQQHICSHTNYRPFKCTFNNCEDDII